MKASDYFRNAMYEHGHDEFKGLRQSERGVKVRHQSAASLIHGHQPYAMLDVACGTGLILETLAEQNLLPQTYYGIDIQDWVLSFALSRVTVQGIDGHFARVEEGKLLPTILSTPKVDVALCLGLVGVEGFQTLDELVELVKALKFVSNRVIISVPVAVPHLSDEDGFKRIPLEVVTALGDEVYSKSCFSLNDIEKMMVF